MPILSGTFASKSYGPSLSGINLVTQSCSESLPKLLFLSTKFTLKLNVFPQNVLENKNKRARGGGLIIVSYRYFWCYEFPSICHHQSLSNFSNCQLEVCRNTPTSNCHMKPGPLELPPPHPMRPVKVVILNKKKLSFFLCCYCDRNNHRQSLLS